MFDPETWAIWCEECLKNDCTRELQYNGAASSTEGIVFTCPECGGSETYVKG